MHPRILVGKGETPQLILGAYANRHGLIAGATGTGKTVTLQVLAEGFSDIGVPVFATDIKGDLAGIAMPGEPHPKLIERARQVGVEAYGPAACPAAFWDVFGQAGHPLRATVSDLGPLLLSRLLDLSDAQAAVLHLVFKYADDQGLLLLDLKDLRAVLSHVAVHAKTLGADYGLVSGASVGAIQRALLQLEQDGAAAFFGEPALDLHDLLRTDAAGRGIVHVLAADRLFHAPRLYATVLLWLLSELFENLPERGDADKPRLVLFFDEAHLLFKDTPKVLVDKIEQVVRLIRSKGVGVYFVTQHPLDLPDAVLGQLGNRIQHALRAFTPRDQKAVRTAAETFRANPALDVASVITELGVGEALVSTLQEGGVPGVVERTRIRPPRSRIGALTAEERSAILARSPLAGRYETAIDRVSAYERLQASPAGEVSGADRNGWGGQAQGARPAPAPARRDRRGDTLLETAVKSAARSVATSLGRELGRQILRGLLGGRSRR
ncbi:hypothetical protein SAMN04488120_10928 [Fontimonas thermophila]|uniref:Helicase HerA-like C-terminal domain-containing protein n=1 Tax=Fontimonas thermophila TaxID=1076937 RepID=A0A1I2JRK5_9GAMM|nr:helicase HerA-like domain-containing protein [Fontimonas thermophila]SFF56593.1 hypothetical protein SAMN04488120_10928 [Fontimonas thermophila]